MDNEPNGRRLLVLRDRDPVEDLNALANAIAESPAELFNWNGGLS